MNEHNATGADMLELIAQVRQRALLERGIHLETEVQIIGEDRSIYG